MHQIFDDEQNLELERIADRLLLREYGISFLGNPADLSCFSLPPEKNTALPTPYIFHIETHSLNA